MRTNFSSPCRIFCSFDIEIVKAVIIHPTKPFTESIRRLTFLNCINLSNLLTERPENGKRTGRASRRNLSRVVEKSRAVIFFEIQDIDLVAPNQIFLDLRTSRKIYGLTLFFNFIIYVNRRNFRLLHRSTFGQRLLPDIECYLHFLL